MSPAPAPFSPAAIRLSTGQWTAIAFAYWVVFMGALAPGNIANGLAAGMAPNWLREIVRLVGAGLLGASVTPLLLALARGFPPTGARRWRNLAIQALTVAGLAPGLVLVSCVLAAWVFAGQLLPSAQNVASEMLANAALL